jgi:hypothetical protein
MAKTGSRIVAAAQKRNKEAGGGRLTMNLTPDEFEQWQTLLASYPNGRGQQKAAFLGAIRAALFDDNTRMSNAELLAELERRLK